MTGATCRAAASRRTSVWTVTVCRRAHRRTFAPHCTRPTSRTAPLIGVYDIAGVADVMWHDGRKRVLPVVLRMLSGMLAWLVGLVWPQAVPVVLQRGCEHDGVDPRVSVPVNDGRVVLDRDGIPRLLSNHVRACMILCCRDRGLCRSFELSCCGLCMQKWVTLGSRPRPPGRMRRVSSTGYSNGDCQDSTLLPSGTNYYGQVYGGSSQCFLGTLLLSG